MLLLVLLLVLFDFNIIVFYLPLLGSFYGVLSATGHRGWSGGGVLRSGEGVEKLVVSWGGWDVRR